MLKDSSKAVDLLYAGCLTFEVVSEGVVELNRLQIDVIVLLDLVDLVLYFRLLWVLQTQFLLKSKVESSISLFDYLNCSVDLKYLSGPLFVSLLKKLLLLDHYLKLN